jgi:hypothetical protein
VTRWPTLGRRVGERARRELGAWPTAESIVNELIARIEAAADVEEQPETKAGLRAAAGTLGSSAYGLAVDVMTKYAEKKAGLG